MCGCCSRCVSESGRACGAQAGAPRLKRRGPEKPVLGCALLEEKPSSPRRFQSEKGGRAQLILSTTSPGSPCLCLRGMKNPVLGGIGHQPAEMARGRDRSPVLPRAVDEPFHLQTARVCRQPISEPQSAVCLRRRLRPLPAKRGYG